MKVFIRVFMGGMMSSFAFSLNLELLPIVKEGLKEPVAVVFEPGNSEKMYLVEQKGRVVLWQEGKLSKTPFLDIQNKVNFGGEKGLLGLAFHPQFSKNGRYFINYTALAPDLKTFIVERNRDNQMERVLLEFSQPYSNHNGGQLAFGPDGFLYIGTGDGGSGGDPLNKSQDLSSVLGKILRIDVDQKLPYGIPQENPFFGENQKREVFALGLRNPWRFSFDKLTGALFVGDVGQNRLEEINVVEKGKNYGWKVMEGDLCFFPKSNCSQKGLEPPIAVYGREEGGSVTGGYVYRGNQIPSLRGIYLYGDFMSGKMWGLNYDQKTRKRQKPQLLLETKIEIASFGEDPTGEIYLVGYSGGVYRLIDKN